MSKYTPLELAKGRRRKGQPNQEHDGKHTDVHASGRVNVCERFYFQGRWVIRCVDPPLAAMNSYKNIIDQIQYPGLVYWFAFRKPAGGEEKDAQDGGAA